MNTESPKLTLDRWQWLGNRLATLEPILLLAAAPFLLFPGATAPYFVLPLLLPWLGRWLSTGRFTRYTPLNAPMFLLLIMAGVGYLISPDPNMSWAKLWGIVLQVAIFFTLVNYASKERRILIVGLGLILGTIAVAILSLVGTDWRVVRLVELRAIYDRIPNLISGLPGSGVPRASSLFSPREVGATMAMLLPIPFMVLFFSRQWRWQLLALVAVILATGVLLLSQALMGLAGLLLAFGFMAVWWRRWMLGPIILAFVGTVVAIIQYGPQRLAITLLDINHVLGVGFVLRFDMWSRALAMIQDMPFTGIGLNTFPLVQSHFYTGYLIGPEVHSHNLFLQLAVDLGLPGLFIFFWLLMALGLMAYRAYPRLTNREVQLLLVGLVAGVIAYVGGGVLDVVTLGAKPIAGLWGMIGLIGAIWVYTEPVAAAVPSRHFPLPKEIKAMALFALPLFLLILLMPAVWYGNLGAIMAHRAIYQVRTQTQLPPDLANQAIQQLQNSLTYQPDNAQFYGLLGSLYAWQGDEPTALAMLTQRVELDGPFALETYAPFEIWRRQLRREPLPEPWVGTSQVYAQWSTRFPDRAESYILWSQALVHSSDTAEPGKALLQQGVTQSAEPIRLLTFALD